MKLLFTPAHTVFALDVKNYFFGNNNSDLFSAKFRYGLESDVIDYLNNIFEWIKSLNRSIDLPIGLVFNFQKICTRCDTLPPVHEIRSHVFPLKLANYNNNIKSIFLDNTKCTTLVTEMCAKCEIVTTKIKWIYVKHFYNTFIFHLRRMNMDGSKLMMPVEVEETLCISITTSCAGINSVMKQKYLQVRSVILHLGPTLHAGHYACLIKDFNDIWYLMDDNSVTQIGSFADMGNYDHNAYRGK